MSKSPSQKREDEVLLRMLKTPPNPHAPLKSKKESSQAKPVKRKAPKPSKPR